MYYLDTNNNKAGYNLNKLKKEQSTIRDRLGEKAKLGDKYTFDYVQVLDLPDPITKNINGIERTITYEWKKISENMYEVVESY